MSALNCWLTYPFVTFFLVRWPSFTDHAGMFFLEKGENKEEFLVLASPPPLTDVRTTGERTPYPRHPVHRSTLKLVGPHGLNFLSLKNFSSSNEPSAESGAAAAIQCTIQFEGAVSEPPTVTVGPAPHPAGPFLTILRDTHPVARGWIHGYQKGVRADSTVRFGASSQGEGEYVEVHPPSGEHTYELLIFDEDYVLGPRLSALIGTPWQNRDRALGSEGAVLEDIRAGNAQSSPRIIGRCATTVSREQLAPAQEDM